MLDFYHAYLTMLLSDSHRVWQQVGIVDRLAEAGVAVGDPTDRAAILDFVCEGGTVALRNEMRGLNESEPRLRSNHIMGGWEAE